ncbi:Uncharacterised protein [Mycolicibacterium gilvum]|uniref:Uncharacterized protein n=1 Tax=Mycolicibacterium gilvum TaxID=1804 RepID=A0A378SP11_9MYCO|nr:Uncharacterised protein [Mycolicibacterium gilvum]
MSKCPAGYVLISTSLPRRTFRSTNGVETSASSGPASPGRGSAPARWFRCDIAARAAGTSGRPRYARTVPAPRPRETVAPVPDRRRTRDPAARTRAGSAEIFRGGRAPRRPPPRSEAGPPRRRSARARDGSPAIGGDRAGRCTCRGPARWPPQRPPAGPRPRSAGRGCRRATCPTDRYAPGRRRRGSGRRRGRPGCPPADARCPRSAVGCPHSNRIPGSRTSARPGRPHRTPPRSREGSSPSCRRIRGRTPHTGTGAHRPRGDTERPRSAPRRTGRTRRSSSTRRSPSQPKTPAVTGAGRRRR